MALALAAVAGRLALVQASPVVPPQPRAVVWGGRVFTNRPQLERWLAARGASYQSWARRHQAEARRFEITTAGSAQGRSQPRVAAADGDGQNTRSLLAPAAAVGGVVLLSLGIAFLVRPRGRTLVPARPERRARRPRVGAVPMPSASKLAALLAAGVRSQRPLAALVATRTARWARSSRKPVAQVGLLAVNVASSLAPTRSGGRRGSRARLRRAQLRPAVVYAIWLLASGLIGTALVLSAR